MERMAKVYLSEGNLEDAYILYLRFSTLFLEKIIEHPEYKSVPATMKQQNRARLKDILGILEEVKKRLMQQYNKDYAAHLVQVETDRLRALELEKSREKEKERERRQLEEKQRRRRETDPSFIGHSIPPSAPSAAELLDNIVYPNDFPSDKNRTPSSGLILADATTDPTKKPLPPSVDRTLKPSTSYNDGGLRTVVVPKDTMFRFLMLVSANTAKNVETCGILAGRLAQNQFLITHVIIPKQKGTPDSCTTMHEEELFDVQDQHNLITLGWIHVSLDFVLLTSKCPISDLVSFSDSPKSDGFPVQRGLAHALLVPADVARGTGHRVRTQVSNKRFLLPDAELRSGIHRQLSLGRFPSTSR